MPAGCTEWIEALAVQATGEPVVYVSALETAARQGLPRPLPALGTAMKGSSKMQLLQRVRNILDPHPTTLRSSWLLAGCLPLGTLGALLLLVTFPSLPTVANPLGEEDPREVGRNAAPAESEVRRDREPAVKRDREGDEREDGEERRASRRRDREGDREEGRAEEERRRIVREDREEREESVREGEVTISRRDLQLLIQSVLDLRREVQQLRREVNALRRIRGPARGDPESERERPRLRDRESDERGERAAPRRREGDLDPGVERERIREGDRARGFDRERAGREREGDREGARRTDREREVDRER